MSTRRGNRRLATCGALAANLLVSGCGQATKPSKAPRPTPAPSTAAADVSRPFDVSTLDRGADPCRNFYQYACGAWLDRTPVPAGRGYVTRTDAHIERDNAALVDVLLASDEPTNDPEVARLRTFFGACMRADDGKDRSEQVLLNWLEQIEREPIDALLLALHEHGIDVFFRYEGWPHPGEPARHRARIRQGVLVADPAVSSSQLREYAAAVFRRLGDNDAKAQRAAKRIAAIELALTKSAMDPEVDLWGDNSTEHTIDRAGLAQLAPRIQWEEYLALVEAPEAINVNSPDYLRAVGRVLSTTPERDLRDYFRFHLAHQLGSSLPQPQRGASTQVREHLCRLATIRALGVEFSRQFARRVLGTRGQQEAGSIASAVREQVVASASSRPWLTPRARVATADKLARTDLKLGSPRRWPSTGGFPLQPDSHLANVLSARRYEQRRKWRRANATRDRADWEMLVRPNGAWGMAGARLMIPNGYPDPFSNSMVIPAASMVAPRFSASAPVEVNFATFGSLVGHELIHVAETYTYDAEGLTRDYWAKEDVLASQEQLACVAARLDAAGASGERCKEETSADFGGLRAAYDALVVELGPDSGERLQAIDRDGFTIQQRFFLAFAQSLCTKMTPEFAEDTAKTDWHAPPDVRVNLSVHNMPEFAEAFSCSAPDSVCSVW